MLEKLKKHKFIIAIAIISLIYFILTSVQNGNFYYIAGYDDFYIMASSWALINFDWLGPFSGTTLTKGIGAPVFIAISNFLGISLLRAQTLLYIGACILFVHVLKHVIKKDWTRLIVFTIILFNPVLYSTSLLRVYRDNINSSFLLYVISFALGIFFNYKENPKKIIPYMFGFGIFTTWMAITREEAIWISPFVIGSSVITCLFIKFDKECLDKFKKISLYLIPIIIYGFTIVVNSALNKYAYGEFVRLETESKAYKDFYKAITSVDVENPNINVPLSREAREKLYEVSPSFAELKEYFEEGGGVEFADNFGTIPNEIEGGWLLWSIISGVHENGYDTDLKSLNNYFRRVTDEVNNAYSSGKLKREDNPASILDEENINKLFDNLNKTYKYQLEMEGVNLKLEQDITLEDVLDKQEQLSDSDYQEQLTLILERQDLFREVTGNDSTNSKTYNYKVDKIKIVILEAILKIYEVLSKPLFIIGLIIYVLIIIEFFVIKPRFENYKELIVLTSLVMLHFIRALVIAYTETALCDAINPMYLSSTYSLQFVFGALAIIFLFVRLYNKFFQKNN